MKKSTLFLLSLFCTFALSAEEEYDDIEVAKEYLLNKQENHFLTSTDYRITPKVNPITGEYTEDELDLIVNGSQPLSVRRFYNSHAPYDPRYATWRYNPEAFLFANLEWIDQEIFAAIGDVDGSVRSLRRSDDNEFSFNFDVPKGFFIKANGQTHPLNTKLDYWRRGDPKDKHRFQYMGTITDGKGRKRTFSSVMHRWTYYVHWKEKKKYREKLWRIHPNTWTPFHILINEEKLPNGNIICYTYTQWKEEKKNYPLPQLLSSITAYNADKSKVLGSITFDYPRSKKSEIAAIQVTGSDGRVAYMQHAGNSPIVLASAKQPGQPLISYRSNGQTLYRVEKPGGCVLTTEYNAEGKVSAQYAPVGSNGKLYPIGRYHYNPNMTQVVDGEGNKKEYHFDDNKQLQSIQTLQNNRVYRVEQMEWDPHNGNCLRMTIKGANGLPVRLTEYKYDDNHNPIEEKIGDGHEWRTIKRTFSDDGFNLLLSESDRNNKLTRYTYVPGTNLLASELTYEGSTIRKRLYHTYDDCAICIKTIVDDGSSEDPHDLRGVTYRKITEITPKQTTPCFGLPEIVEEKTLDAQGQEILLSKVVYTYTPFGQILHEDHYDANNELRFSLYNTYDEEERLIAKTDPLGAQILYTYDANHNVTSITGPRPDQYCEITYDKMNRPTRIAEWQTDGAILITEKQYNKLGQVIKEIDPCNQATCYEYDALGRIIVIHHPDGAVERKEYDLLDNVVKEIDPEGYETTKTFNAFNQPLSIYYPDGSEEHFTYNTTGTLHRHQDKNGAITIYEYDLFDHPIRSQTYSSSGSLLKSISSNWSPFNKLSETEDDLTTTYTYDFAGRKTKEQTAYKTTHYTYDALGQLMYTQQDDTCLVNRYDLCGRIILTRVECGNAVQKQEEYAYDVAGNRTQIITSQGIIETQCNSRGKPLCIKDSLGFATLYAYSYADTFSQTITNSKSIQTVSICDARGREKTLIKKNARGDIIQHSESGYDKNGNLVRLEQTIFSGIIPIKTTTHTWEYGPQGRLECFVEAGAKKTDYLYDHKGRLHALIKPDGTQILHEYDERGRLTRYYAHDFDYHYAYDARDRVVQVHDAISNTTTIRSYDPLNNVLKETLGNGLTLSNSYDRQGRRIKCTLPDNSSISYSYVGIYLNEVSRAPFTHTYVARNLEGQLTQAFLPAKVGELNIERDALGRYSQWNTPYYQAHHFQYDPVGNLVRYAYLDGLGQNGCSYAYDDLDQLIEDDTHTYQFDSLQNRLKKDTQNYEINALCQVVNDGQSEYAYDVCGNLISDGVRTYTYDSLDRLIAIEDGEQKTTYTYDPFHRRLTKTLDQKGHTLQITHYIWDGDDEIGTVDGQGHVQELRVLGEGLGAEIGAAVLYELNHKPYVPIHDPQGCVVTLIDPHTQTAIEYYRYSAFGEEQTEGTLSPWRFSSKRVDEETGLIFFGRRYYDPNLGRWMTQDPEGFGPKPYTKRRK